MIQVLLKLQQTQLQILQLDLIKLISTAREHTSKLMVLGTADLAAYINKANASLTGNFDDIYSEYNFSGEGNTLVVIDENKSGSVDAGDTLIILSGLSTADGLTPLDFI